MLTPFFFDIVDLEYITGIWAKLEAHVEPSSLLGVTTNPNTLDKVQCRTLADLERVVPELCKLVTQLRGADGGLVFVQTPYSKMPDAVMLKWAGYVKGLGDGHTEVGIKIPHYTYALDVSMELLKLGLPINVTGITDWGTMLKALAYPTVSWASVLPGRMDVVGIPTGVHLEAMASVPRKRYQRIISGSMRTVDGLKEAITYDTVPTIGARVWDLVDFEEFPRYWSDRPSIVTQSWNHFPVITEANRQLSQEFFDQMDELGDTMYAEFVEQRAQKLEPHTDLEPSGYINAPTL